MKIPYKRTKDGITLTVKVQPRSSKTGLEVEGDTLKVRLTSPPVDGAANEQLIEILSGALKVKKSSLRIIKGLTSRYKVIEIKGMEGI